MRVCRERERDWGLANISYPVKNCLTQYANKTITTQPHHTLLYIFDIWVDKLSMVRGKKRKRRMKKKIPIRERKKK